jgi:preprotein translocase subunit YajC
MNRIFAMILVGVACAAPVFAETPAQAGAAQPAPSVQAGQPGAQAAPDAAQPAAADQQPPQQGPASLMKNIMPFILIFGIMYFLMIRPQQKKQREKEALLKQVGVGDKLVTTGGIYGVVTQVKQDTVRLKIDDNTRIELAKAAIATVIEKAEGGPPAQQ